jgi:sulfur carrier protein
MDHHLLAAKRQPPSTAANATFDAVKVIANGAPTDLPEGATLTDLLDALGLGAKWVVAERNGEAVTRKEMGRTLLVDGDQIELVRAVAGG